MEPRRESEREFGRFDLEWGRRKRLGTWWWWCLGVICRKVVVEIAVFEIGEGFCDCGGLCSV